MAHWCYEYQYVYMSTEYSAQDVVITVYACPKNHASLTLLR